VDIRRTFSKGDWPFFGTETNIKAAVNPIHERLRQEHEQISNNRSYNDNRFVVSIYEVILSSSDGFLG